MLREYCGTRSTRLTTTWRGLFMEASSSLMASAKSCFSQSVPPPQRAGNSQSIRSSAYLNASVLRTDCAVSLECRKDALCDRLDQPRRGGQSDCITNPPQEQHVQKHQRDYPQQPAASSCSVHNVSAGGCLQHAGRDHQHQAGSQIDEPKLGGQRLFTELVLLAAAYWIKLSCRPLCCVILTLGS